MRADRTAGDLHQRFVLQPDESKATFVAKYKKQLAKAPDETIQLAGELLYAQTITPADISKQKKVETVETVLSWTREPVAIPGELKEGLGGQARP